MPKVNQKQPSERWGPLAFMPLPLNRKRKMPVRRIQFQALNWQNTCPTWSNFHHDFFPECVAKHELSITIVVGDLLEQYSSTCRNWSHFFTDFPWNFFQAEFRKMAQSIEVLILVLGNAKFSHRLFSSRLSFQLVYPAFIVVVSRKREILLEDFGNWKEPQLVQTTPSALS